MNVNGKPQRSIWVKGDDDKIIQIIDQRYLPHFRMIHEVTTTDEAAKVIKEMYVRGAPLIGVTAAYGMYLATLEARESNVGMDYLMAKKDQLFNTRPTAVNLPWALEVCIDAISKGSNADERVKIARETADKIAEDDVEMCRMIGVNGLPLIEEISKKKNGDVVNILTHCNAGWLATVDWGTATSPIYHAFEAGIKIHVWVDETRPRNQGYLTAWELGNHGVPHTVIVDNTGGHLMQHGMVDMCIVGSDRTTYTGDVANKIGTYLKALAAHDNGVPFYVALPSSTFDWDIRDGIKEIPIETRSEDEITHLQGVVEGNLGKVQGAPTGSPVVNYGFDVTPSKYVTGLITERGVCEANERSILDLFPEKQPIA